VSLNETGFQMGPKSTEEVGGDYGDETDSMGIGQNGNLVECPN